MIASGEAGGSVGIEGVEEVNVEVELIDFGNRPSKGGEEVVVGESGAVEVLKTFHSGSNHFHSVVVLSRAWESVLLGEGVYITVGGGRENEEGGEEGFRAGSVLRDKNKYDYAFDNLKVNKLTN